MGSDTLIDPWQPNLLVIPFFSLLVTTAAVVAGAHRWLLAVVFLASLCAQTHLSYILLAPAIAVGAVVSIVCHARSQCTPLPKRMLLVSIIVGLVLWLPPLWQQSFGPGPGNLSSIIGGDDGASRFGLSAGVRLVTTLAVVPPAWLRPSYNGDPPLLLFSNLIGLGSALAILFGLTIVAACFILRARACNIVSTVPLMTVLVGTVLLSILTTSLVPYDVFGGGVHKYRYLWAVGAFFTASFATHLLAEVSLRREALARFTAILVTVGTVIFAALTVRVDEQLSSDYGLRDTWKLTESLREQIAAADIPEGVLVEPEPRFPEFFAAPVMAELVEHGIQFEVANETYVAQVGEGRRDSGVSKHRLYFRYGSDADETPAGSSRVGFVDGGHADLHVAVFLTDRRS
jgi:hypothetical protein